MGKRYLYVEARDVASFDEMNVLVSFDSVIVVTGTEDAAYRIGPQAILQQRAEKGDEFAHGARQLLNDYVVEIPE